MWPRILLLITIMALLSCQSESSVMGDESEQPKSGTVDSLDGDLVEANTRFAMRLFREVATPNPSENVFISPPSVAVALAMTYNGADGETREAMARALNVEHFDLGELNSSYSDLLALLKNPDSAVELSIANSLWARQGLPFRKDFLERNRESYSAKIEELNFGSADAAPTINGWVKDQTRGKISKIVNDPIDTDMIMFLLNAIYFKGTWTREFADSLTTERTFTRGDGSRIQHPLMNTTDTLPYFDGGTFESVSIPYGSERVSMYVFLPNRDSDLPSLLAQLNAQNWDQWIHSYRRIEGNLALPKFKMEYEVRLKDALTALGMGVAFSEQEADFSRMIPVTPSQNVYISEVKHKTFVEVNEQGTEAAAVTSVGMATTSFDPDPPQRFDMIVDRPFLFAIRDNRTGIVLFMGVIVDPSAEG
ncbi:MAG: serpin family protein [Candidatus Zixiibacteriota bacterium]